MLGSGSGWRNDDLGPVVIDVGSAYDGGELKVISKSLRVRVRMEETRTLNRKSSMMVLQMLVEKVMSTFYVENYSNLPNNCAGPFNCVGGRFLRN